MTNQQASAADLIITEIKSFARLSPLNRMPAYETDFIFDEPLVHFADGADPIFNEYQQLIGGEHLTPREALARIGCKAPDALPEHLSVISWILPITEKTRLANRRETRLPSRSWSHTRWHGEIFNEALRNHVVEFLTAKGYLAVAPGLPQYIKIFNNEKGMYSSWSERHVAYAAGLGTFSLSDGFISERGIAHRCGSVVTSLELPASPKTAGGPYDNCLFYVNEKCHACIERCPAGAITAKGHDKARCGQYLRDIGYNPEKFRQGYNLETSVAGCGLCQTKVPCEALNPTTKLKK
jgi:epoxyqueuosine reductase